MSDHALYLFSFILRAFLAFYTLAVFVQVAIPCFKITNYRVRYFLRLLPFAFVILELFSFRNGLGNWLNPLNCASCTQKILAKIFALEPSFVSDLFLRIPPYIAFVFTICFYSVTIFLFSYRFFSFPMCKACYR